MLGLALIVLSSAWLVIVAVLVAEVTGLRRRGRHVRWQAAGLLLATSAAVADALAAQRGWPPARRQAVHLAVLAVAAAGAAVFGIGLRRQGRRPGAVPGEQPSASD